MKVYLVMETKYVSIDDIEEIYMATFYKEKAIRITQEMNDLSKSHAQKHNELKSKIKSLPLAERHEIAKGYDLLPFYNSSFEYKTVEVEEDSPPSL